MITNPGDFFLGWLVGGAVTAFVACSSPPPKAPCDPATLAGIIAECSTRVELECASKGVIEAECQALKDCDARIDARTKECS